jgi:hypothetical protein
LTNSLSHMNIYWMLHFYFPFFYCSLIIHSEAPLKAGPA